MLCIQPNVWYLHTRMTKYLSEHGLEQLTLYIYRTAAKHYIALLCTHTNISELNYIAKRERLNSCKIVDINIVPNMVMEIAKWLYVQQKLIKWAGYIGEHVFCHMLTSCMYVHWDIQTLFIGSKCYQKSWLWSELTETCWKRADANTWSFHIILLTMYKINSMKIIRVTKWNEHKTCRIPNCQHVY